MDLVKLSLFLQKVQKNRQLHQAFVCGVSIPKLVSHMAKLKYEDCPGVSAKRIDAVNDLSDEELLVEIERGRASRFKETMIPVLKLALKKRNEVVENEKRKEQLDIARKANEIASSALTQAEIANKKSDQARIWSAVAIFVAVIIAAIGWFRS